MRKKTLKSLGALLVIGIFLTITHPANATMILSLTQGATIQIEDGSALDSNPDAGVISYTGIFDLFSLNLTTGTSYPDSGTTQLPYLELDYFNVVPTNTITLQPIAPIIIELTNTDFDIGVPSGLATMDISGDAYGLLMYNAYFDSDNNTFGKINLIDSLGVFGPGEFSGTTSSTISPLGNFSLTQQIVFNPILGPGFTTFDGNGSNGSVYSNSTIYAKLDVVPSTAPVPEPSTLLLLGAGLTGLAVWRKKRS